MKSTFAEHQLPNGLRVVCETMSNVCSAAAGFLVRTGSRHERPDEHGVSHFLEHMCFKGTATRGSREVNVRFDQLGSIYNAFTSKDHTFYYGWVPAARVGEQIELLADMMRSTLPAADFETERKVILEEIAMSDDSFERHTSMFMHREIYGDHPLAHEILGEQETIENLPRQRLVDYQQQRYAPENMVLIAAGDLDAQQVFAAAGRYCGDWRRATNGQREVVPPPDFDGGVRKCLLPQFQQQSVILVYASVPEGHAFEETLEAFTSLFGGHNSRCYWNIVQKGVCAQAGAAWMPYADCGVMALYADGEPERCEEMLAALREQAANVSKNGFTPAEVQRVRNHRRTGLALEGETPRTRLSMIVDDLEVYGYPRTVGARMAAVDAVSEQNIADYLRAYPITGDGLLLSVGPRDWPA